MAYQIAQCKIIKNKNGKFEVQASDSGTLFSSGKFEENKYIISSINRTYPIYQLGIQSLPGLKIQINDNGTEVVVGQTGIFELNLLKATPIYGFSLTNLEQMYENSTTMYVLIDVVYEGDVKQEVEVI